MDIVPEGTATVGPGFNPRMEDFIYKHWNIEAAMKHSRSLEKAVLRIKGFLK